ncbi:MAG: C25 family cysteine peptidase, partial [Gemmatimonadota bacterium]
RREMPDEPVVTETLPDPADELYANGVSPEGAYLVPPVSAHLLAMLAQGEPLDPAMLKTLQHAFESKSAPTFGATADWSNLAASGWGILFSAEDQDRVAALKDALAPLLARRKAQAGARYYELEKEKAYRKGESKDAFLKRFKLGPGPVDPEKLPYYLLIVADPRKIPFRFQYQLDVQFAVGRLHFDADDDATALRMFARYANSVVEVEELAEAGKLACNKQAALFGVHNDGDKNTALSSSDLVVPLASELQADAPDWKVSAAVEDGAMKSNLGALLAGGDDQPAFLFTASHGLGIKPDDPQQLARQGALVCGDWAGPGTKVTDADIFSAADVDSKARLRGVIAFHFACFGAGTPQLDDFSAGAGRVPIAPYPFIARLPQTLLSNPGGAALAVVGHIDRAWGYSFNWGEAGPQRTVFRRAFGGLLSGMRIGEALDDFNRRYAEMATILSAELEDIKNDKTPDEGLLARYWTANSDARNYVLLGDPAVRLPVTQTPAAGMPAAGQSETAPVASPPA